ncbi:MAG: hypothetical protein EGQ57_06215 [Alphaproteobacteria bacterium]|nr:hypothetical protein [Alphaproteobacteria bacterium]
MNRSTSAATVWPEWFFCIFCLRRNNQKYCHLLQLCYYLSPVKENEKCRKKNQRICKSKLMKSTLNSTIFSFTEPNSSNGSRSMPSKTRLARKRPPSKIC